eukprot:Platyproteum_vivax@DN5692_c0_g1_i1.p1
MMSSHSMASLHSPRPPLPRTGPVNVPQRCPVPSTMNKSNSNAALPKNIPRGAPNPSLKRTEISASTPSLCYNNSMNISSSVKSISASQTKTNMPVVPSRRYLALTPSGGYVQAPVNIVEKIEIHNEKDRANDIDKEVLRQHSLRLNDLQHHIVTLNSQHDSDRDVLLKLLQDKDAQITMLMQHMQHPVEVKTQECCKSSCEKCDVAMEDSVPVETITRSETQDLRPVVELSCADTDSETADTVIYVPHSNLGEQAANSSRSHMTNQMSANPPSPSHCRGRQSGAVTERQGRCREKSTERGGRPLKAHKSGKKRSSSVVNTCKIVARPPKIRHSLQGQENTIDLDDKARQLLKATPAYSAVNLDDQIDLKIEEEMQKSGIVVPFRRINHGFYSLGDPAILMVGLELKNNKLLAKVPYWNQDRSGSFSNFLKWAKPKVLTQLKANLENKPKSLAVSISQPAL